MHKIKVYLDNCCFNRPYDNQNNLVVFLETEAKLFIQDLIHSEKLMLVWSFVLDYENNDNPFFERKRSISAWKNLATVDCDLCEEIANTAGNLLKIGLRQKDASLIIREPFDYTEWQRNLYKDVPLEVFLKDAMDFRLSKIEVK